MSDLSPVAKDDESDADRLKGEITLLRRGSRGNRRSPHKLVLVLAVLDLFDESACIDNRIYYDERLKERFTYQFSRFSRHVDLCQIAPPFFHLRSSAFWHLQPKAGREAVYATLDTSGGGSRRIVENIEYAFLADFAYRAINNESTRNHLRLFVENLLWSEWMNG